MSRYLLLGLTLLTVPMLAAAQPELTPPGPPPNALPANALPDLPAEEEGVEALTKGPIHEAFADPADPNPEPSPIVPKAPPADVPEQPAAYQPEGNFIWISGYWSWDDDRDDFLWVTGVWRQPPPNMRWVTGYWNEVPGGWQRVKGFWMPDEVQEVAYYSQPPASLEAGPSSPAPASNYFWIPGSWSYASANTGFNWQAGYWAPYQPDWVYVPARWIWTPAGFVYVAGYWDYRLGSRGQIFAPVYFRSPIYAQAGWYYHPSIVIPTSNLFIHLWIQPRYGSYYFGNYFGPQYANRGFVAWSNLPSHHHHYHYDPFYSYAGVHYRQQGVDYLGRVQGWHNYYAQHPEHRPPSTFREQRDWLRSPAAAGVSNDAQLVARPIGEIARQTDSPIKLTRLNEQTLQKQAEHAKQTRELDIQRRNLEREHAHVSVNRPQRDDDRPREQGKTGPLVDRVEKGGRIEKGAGDKGDKGPGTRPIAGGEVAKATQTAKLSLPKIEMPKTTDVTAHTPTTGELPKGNDRANAPPLPRADRNPRAGGNQETSRQNTSVTPQNTLPDASKSSSRSTFGAKTGDQPQFPNRNNDPRLPGRDGRVQTNPSGDVPGLPQGIKTNPTSPGRDVTIQPGNSGSPLQPRDRTPPNATQPNNIPPNITPPGGSRDRGSDIPSLPPTGKSNPTLPGRDISPSPGKSGFTPQGRERSGQQGATSPNTNVPTITPPIGNRDRGAPRNDQPTFQGFGSKPGGGNVNPPQPQSQPPRSPSRPESSGSSNENKKKGKDRN